MLTSLAAVKEHVLTISTGMSVTVQDENTVEIYKGRKIVKPTNSRDMFTRIETQTAKNSSETRRNEIQTETINVISMQQL